MRTVALRSQGPGGASKVKRFSWMALCRAIKTSWAMSSVSRSGAPNHLAKSMISREWARTMAWKVGAWRAWAALEGGKGSAMLRDWVEPRGRGVKSTCGGEKSNGHQDAPGEESGRA